MNNYLNSKPATQETIFYSAFLRAIDEVATVLYSDLMNRYYLLHDWEHYNLALSINLQSCREFESKLVNLLGKEFFNNMVLDLTNLITNSNSSQQTLAAGTALAPFPPNTDYTYEDLEVATNCGIELSVKILQKLHRLNDYKPLKNCKTPQDVKKSIHFLKSLLGTALVKAKLPPIGGWNSQIETQIEPAKPKLFTNNSVEPVSSAFPIIATLQAQILTDRWENSDEGATYREQAKKKPENSIELYVSDIGDLKILPWEEAQQIISKLGLNTAKLHLLFASCCMNLPQPWNGSFELKGSDVIKLLGWDKQTYESRSYHLNKFAKLASTLSSLVAKVTWKEGKNKKGQIVATCSTGRIWDVAVTKKGALNNNLEIDNPEEVFIKVKPGVWTEIFLNKAGTEGRTAMHQFGWVSQDVLKIDAYHNELALRLALSLSLKNRCHKEANYRVENLLRDILPQSELENAKSDRRRGSELKQRWDKALLLLASLGWRITYGQTYPSYLFPGTNQKRLPNGFLEVLFNAIVIIHQPEPIPSRFQESPTGNAFLSSLTHNPDDWSNTKIKELREAKGLTQRYLATLLGISQPQLHRLENSERTIKPEIIEKLKRLTDPYAT